MNAFLIWLAGIATGVFIGLAIQGKGRSDLLDACQKQHNVYACELTAMPVKPEAAQ